MFDHVETFAKLLASEEITDEERKLLTRCLIRLYYKPITIGTKYETCS